MHTVVKSLPLEEQELVCEVTYQFCPGCGSKGEWKYSLGTPAEPPSVEVIYVGYKGKNITKAVPLELYTELESELLEAHRNY